MSSSLVASLVGNRDQRIREATGFVHWAIPGGSYEDKSGGVKPWMQLRVDIGRPTVSVRQVKDRVRNWVCLGGVTGRGRGRKAAET